MKHYYTEKQFKELLDHMVILVDTRDKTNDGILEWFDKNKIKYKKKALKTGDYNFMIESCPELGFSRDTFFTDDLSIERKGNVNELAGNMVEKDSRFMREVGRMKDIDNVYIVIEDDNIGDIFEHNYRSQYNEYSFLRALLTMQKQTGFYLYFCPKKHMGEFIYEICRNCLTDKILK